jgi:hypothetical protein
MAKFDVMIGIVVEDKPLDSRRVKVYLREFTPFAGGEIKDNTRTETYTVANEKGEAVSGNVKTSNTIVADYFGLATNSTFPPDVVKGEQVYVFKYGDEDKYYWMSAGRDDNLRKTEIVRWTASNSEASNKELSEDNTYFVEIDTKVGKRIRMHTSKSSGESFGYDIVIDAQAGFVKIADDSGNSIELESAKKRVSLRNPSGSVINLEDKNITLIAPDNIVLKAGKQLVINAPKIESHGPLTCNGPMTNNGSMTNNGNIVNNGSITNEGNISASGTIHGANIP